MGKLKELRKANGSGGDCRWNALGHVDSRRHNIEERKAEEVKEAEK